MRCRRAVLIRTLLLMLAGALIAPSASAAPPRPDEKGYDPAFAPWFQSLRDEQGTPCCSIADCRAVESRVTGEGYEIHPLHAYDDRIAPDDELRWTRVPEGKILAQDQQPDRARHRMLFGRPTQDRADSAWNILLRPRSRDVTPDAPRPDPGRVRRGCGYDFT